MTLLEWTADPHGELKLKLNKNSVSIAGNNSQGIWLGGAETHNITDKDCKPLVLMNSTYARFLMDCWGKLWGFIYMPVLFYPLGAEFFHVASRCSSP